MGLIVRLVFWLLLILVLALVGIWVGRGLVAEYIIERGLASAGIENADFQVETLTGEKLVVRDLKVGPANQPGLELNGLEVSYNWRALWNSRRVEKVVIGPGHARLKMSESGTITIVGMPTSNGNGSQSTPFDPSALPLENIEIRPIRFELETPEGMATGNLSGGYEIAKGGAFTFKAKADRAGPNGIIISGGDIFGTLTLEQDGNAALNAAIKGNVTTPAYAVNNVNIAVAGTGTSWIGYIQNGLDDFTGNIMLDVQSAKFPLVTTGDMPPNQLTTLARNVESYLGAKPLENLSITGALRGEISKEGVVFYFAKDKSFEATSNAGDKLSFNRYRSHQVQENNPTGSFLEYTNESIEIATRATLESRLLNLSINFAMGQKKPGETYSFNGEVLLPKQDIAIHGTEYKITGVEIEQNVSGEINTKEIFNQSFGLIKFDNIRTSNMSIDGLQYLSYLDLEYSEQKKTLEIAMPRSACPTTKRIKLLIPDDNLIVNANTVKICPNKGSFGFITLSDSPHIEYNFNAAAQSVSYNHAELNVTGIPPELDISGTYSVDEQSLTTKGSYKGGDVILNEGLRLSRAQGDIEATIIGTDMVATSMLDTVRIAQADTKNIMINPVIGKGRLTYREGRADYEATASTPDGTPLGSGEGTHSIDTGIGNLDVQFEELVFLPDGLQPDQVLPSLIGIIKDANGTMTGTASFSWQPDIEKITSSADIFVTDLTFDGPGTAVTQTGGITGALKLKDLQPVTSDGVQSLFIDYIDLNALRLEKGDVAFEFPGNDTLDVMSAEFPWFGGTIGAYDTKAAMTGERVVTALKAYEVDLGQLLGFLEIEGLSGEGTIEGELPLVVQGGKISIENGLLAADGPGVIRFDSEATRQAAQTSQQAGMAFGILRKLKFDTLRAEIAGPLDGDVTINLLFEGINDIDIQGQRVPAPVIYRIKLDAPLSNLIYQGRVTTDYVLQQQIIEGVVRGQVSDQLRENP